MIAWQPGVTWIQSHAASFLKGSDLPMSPRRNCQVTEIDLGSRSEEVNGALDERFGEFEELQKLNLASSKASGDIGLLRNNTKLKVLHMSGTSISGDISTILRWKDIQSVDLSGTDVAGQLDGNWKGCCKELQDLKLAQVELKVVPPQLETGEKHSWMPKLTNLDLTGSPVNLEVSSLLKSFQHCTSLGSIQAGRSGLTGRLDGRDGTPSLVALDLGWNHLTHVEAVPPRCKSLILTGNSHITFAPGILRGAIKDRVFLDLQNVSFDQQEPCHVVRTKISWFECNVGWMFCSQWWCHATSAFFVCTGSWRAFQGECGPTDSFTDNDWPRGQIRLPLVMMLAALLGGELGLLKMVVGGLGRLNIPHILDWSCGTGTAFLQFYSPLPQVWILQTSLGDILVPLPECIIMLPCTSLHKSSHILTLSCLTFFRGAKCQHLATVFAYFCMFRLWPKVLISPAASW